jgi:hypothetical protein
MTYPPRPVRRPARFLFRPCTLAWSAAIVLAAAGLSWAGTVAYGAIQTRGTPTCSWPLKVQGAPNAAQAGLARCYLRDLAQGDTAGLQATAADIPAVRITRADLKYEADAPICAPRSTMRTSCTSPPGTESGSSRCDFRIPQP